MKYKCCNGHENHADALPQRCPVCGSSLLKVLSGGPTAPASSAARAPGPVAAPPRGAPPVFASVASAGRRRSAWPFVLVGLLLVVVFAALMVWAVLGRKDTDSQMAAVARQYENAVGVVILAGKKDGQPVSMPIATAWAMGEKVFVSNAHVAQPVAEALDNGWAAFIVLNKHPEQKLRIIEAVVHPKFGQQHLNVEGKEPAVPAYDIGLLRVDTPAPNRLRIAGEAELRKIDSGYRVAYLGFPMENLAGQGVDAHNPVANMQSGIITSTTDYWLSKAPFAQTLLLSHNLAATGGASGSPIFNAAGEVVGVLSAGNVIGQIDFKSGKRTRSPSAAMINFAQRIDLLGDFFPERPASTNRPAADIRSAPQPGKPGGCRILVKWKQNPQTAVVKTFLASTYAQELRTFQRVGEGKLQVLTLPPGKNAETKAASV